MLRCFVFNTSLFIIIFLAPVAQKMNSAIHLISLQAKKHLISLMRIYWIVIYPADSMILCLNNRGLMKLRDLSQGPWSFFFVLSHSPLFSSQQVIGQYQWAACQEGLYQQGPCQEGLYQQGPCQEGLFQLGSFPVQSPCPMLG